MAQILTYAQYLTLVYTTDKSQQAKYDFIYTDIENTYVKNILSRPTYDKVIAGTYTIVNRASMFAELKKCIAKRIEIEYINTGAAELTALGMVHRTNQFSEAASKSEIDRKIDSISAVLANYENELKKILEVVANFPEYISDKKNITSNNPYKFTAVGNKCHYGLNNY